MPRIAEKRDRQLEKIDRREHGIALRNLAKVLHWSGKFSEAAPRAVDALKWLGDDAESRFVLADCLRNMSQPDKAREQYELLMASHPDYSRAFLPYGELLTDLGEDDKALGYLLSAILVEPDNAYLHFTLGRNHLQRQEFGLAVESLEIANRLQPQDPAIAVTTGRGPRCVSRRVVDCPMDFVPRPIPFGLHRGLASSLAAAQQVVKIQSYTL